MAQVLRHSSLNLAYFGWYPLETAGGVQYPAFIDEGNLYRLIIKSKKPEAEAFESWVCDEVLPSIRKTGSYAVDMARYEEIESHLKTQKQLIDAQHDQIAYIRDKAERMVAGLQNQLKVAQMREDSLRINRERSNEELNRAVRAQRPIGEAEKAEIAQQYQSGWTINMLVFHFYRNTGIIRRTLREKGLLA